MPDEKRGPQRFARMRSLFTGLWRHPDFRKFWVGQTISLLGSQVSLLAIPLTAVMVLAASPTQMGVLVAVESAPWLVVGLFAGVWVDRIHRRPVMITADLGRAGLLILIPIAAANGALRIELLYIVSFAVSVLTVFANVAQQSFLPSLVQREHIVEGNSKIAVSRSIAEVAGPGLGGALVQAVTAPIAIIVDAVSFVLSALFLGLIRASEPAMVAPNRRRSVWAEIGEGLRVVFGVPLLRALVVFVGIFNLSAAMLHTLFALYVTRELGVEPAIFGIILVAGSIVGIPGALLAEKASKTYGIGPAIIGGGFLAGLSNMLIPAANGPIPLIVVVLVSAQTLSTLAGTIGNVNLLSLSQAVTPDRLLGRVSATRRMISWGMPLFGALLSGALGQMIGLRPTLALGALGQIIAAVLLLTSAVHALREQPEPLDVPGYN
jgi:predicted MFS family arabinose efflux permease